jgi:transcriptional regulator with XRE-family HTH domain
MHDMATLRRLRGLSQRALATKAGLSPSRVAEAETGTRPLSVDAATKAAGVLGVDSISLYLECAVRSIKSGIETGEERPIKAPAIARALLMILQEGNLTRAQEGAVRSAVQQLVDLASETAEKQRAGSLGSLVRRRRDSSATKSSTGGIYAALGRDNFGRKLP